MTQDKILWRERAALKNIIRDFFGKRTYLEIDTPILVKSPGTEVHLQYFQSDWIDFRNAPHGIFLRSSPELHMKQALATGLDKVFQLAQCFRNGGERSEWHQPEFTMLEWYERGLSYQGLIDQTEDLLQYTAKEMSCLTGVEPIAVIPERFERWSVYEAFEEFVGVALIDRDPDLSAKAMSVGVHSVQKSDNFEIAFFKCLIERIEPKIFLNRGTVLFDYPPSQAALAMVQNNRACRFEFYVGRIELSNGFFELMGTEENRKRIAEAAAERKLAQLSEIPIDEEFLLAMDKIGTSCAGNALGFDRWLALLCNNSNLDRAIPFRNAAIWK